jgi:hypothetical protein
VRVLLHDVRADDVGRHQVGRELDARELQVQHVGERVHEARLADARDALEQHVATPASSAVTVWLTISSCPTMRRPTSLVILTNRSRKRSIC